MGSLHLFCSLAPAWTSRTALAEGRCGWGFGHCCRLGRKYRHATMASPRCQVSSSVLPQVDGGLKALYVYRQAGCATRTLSFVCRLCGGDAEWPAQLLRPGHSPPALSPCSSGSSSWRFQAQCCAHHMHVFFPPPRIPHEPPLRIRENRIAESGQVVSPKLASWHRCKEEGSLSIPASEGVPPHPGQ